MESFEAFITVVERGARLDRAAAERAVRATLQTLGERIAPGEAAQLAAELPPELAPWVATNTPAERFDLDEFVRRVAERAGVDPASAERQAAAVFTALQRAVSRKELHDVIEELPTPEFARLLPAGPALRVMEIDDFLDRVAKRAGIDRAAAERATDAVLETLAERIAAGEVRDLLVRLPLELHDALRRGAQHGDGAAVPMSFDEFIRRVAEREGGDVDPLLGAREHARAVLVTLREAVGDDEWFDVTVQLPREYDAVLAR
jgi:uncharacterized protein (DUF2267 family)